MSQDGTGTRLVTGGGQIIVGRSRAVLVGQEETMCVVTAGTGAGQVIMGHSLVEHGRGGAGVGVGQDRDGQVVVGHSEADVVGQLEMEYSVIVLITVCAR